MKYGDEDFQIEYEKFPTLIPILLNTQGKSILGAWRGASARRLFCLENDWHLRIQLRETEYDHCDLSGDIVIPVSFRQSLTLLDGASVPLPWLVSFLSFGLLRPLGVMLTASIVHDFAFQYGGLVYAHKNGEREFRPVRRDLADKLFSNIIQSVNDMPITARLAWLAVRLGWFFVKYNGRSRGGKPPILATFVLIAILLCLAGVIFSFGLEICVTSVALFYLLMFILLKGSAPPSK
ncbi:DUF1353 domain-containing protein [Acaryochloris sp. IP29b_bin.137]|uniref:DUF1353 domain-containing protein n=1 Tax=Acaryochloris sp. IP29b_bin.137 TaxID=2969217 RepID=UPI00260E87BD|nr:DUF1353 domain-containing protein [Acaryochloris sp. IP29b_bin.137]